MEQKQRRAIAAAGIVNADAVVLGIGNGESSQEFSHLGSLGIMNSHRLPDKRD
jgi:phosphopantothenate synthetase